MLKKIPKIVLVVILFGFFVGIFFNNFPNKVLAKDTPAAPTPVASTDTENNKQALEDILQRIQNNKNGFYDYTKELKENRQTISDDRYLFLYQTAVNSKNHLRTDYIKLAKLGYDKTYWQNSYNEAKTLIKNMSDEFVIIKNSDYVIQMADSQRPEIIYDDNYVDTNATPAEQQRQKTAIENKIAAEQKAAAKEAAEKAAQKNRSCKSLCAEQTQQQGAGGNLMSWIANSTPFQSTLCELECAIVNAIGQILEWIQNILNQVPL